MSRRRRSSSLVVFAAPHRKHPPYAASGSAEPADLSSERMYSMRHGANSGLSMRGIVGLRVEDGKAEHAPTVTSAGYGSTSAAGGEAGVVSSGKPASLRRGIS